MYAYTAFGLDIHSDLPLPELHPGGGRTDVEIRCRRGTLGGTPPEDDAVVTPDASRIVWTDVGAFTVRGGRDILVEPLDGADDRQVRMGVLGPAMAALLQQRGVLALHASVVDVGGLGVAFIGESGAGKSTTAAALESRGHAVVGDDLAPVVLGPAGPQVFPGSPQLRLWPDSLTALGHDPASLPLLEPDREKRTRDVAARANPRQPLPLVRVYLLDWGEDVRITPLSPRDAFVELLRHSYGVHWMHAVAGVGQFAFRAEVARRVPVHRLTRPRDLGALAELITRVEADLAIHR